MDDLTWTKFAYDFVVVGLTSGLISGVISGLLLDSFVRRREERRWEPVKHQLYVALLTAVEDLFFHAFPSRVGGKPFYQLSFKVYAFGADLFGKVMYEPQDRDPFSLVNEALIEAFRQDWQSGARAEQLLHPDTPPTLLSPPQLGALENARDAIQDKLQTYGAVFDAKLRGMVGKFAATLNQAIEMGGQNRGWSDESVGFYINRLVMTLDAGLDIRNYVRPLGKEYVNIQAWLDDQPHLRADRQ